MNIFLLNAESESDSNIEQEGIANLFKVIFLSQNEIIKIAEDENEQIKFIDSFFDNRLFKI